LSTKCDHKEKCSLPIIETTLPTVRHTTTCR